jgi:hypothetical protein
MKTYGELLLTAASPEQSFIEPLTIDDVKAAFKISTTNDKEDPWIQSLITAARGIAETEQGGVDLCKKQYDLHLDVLLDHDVLHNYQSRHMSFYFDADMGINLRFPLKSVDLLTIRDSTGTVTTLTEGYNGDYLVDLNRGRVIPPYGQIWPFYTPDVSSSVLIRFTSGYGPMDAFWKDSRGHCILQGMRMLVAGWYDNRFPFGSQMYEVPFGITTLLRTGARSRAF